VMDWDALDRVAALRISGDIRALRTARIASGGAGAPATIATSTSALLGIACGSDRVFLNFSPHAVQVGDLAGWHDRVADTPIGDDAMIGPWSVLWAGPSA
jgi:amylosucrase